MERIEKRYSLILNPKGEIRIVQDCYFNGAIYDSDVVYYDGDFKEYIGKRVSKALGQWILFREKANDAKR